MNAIENLKQAAQNLAPALRDRVIDVASRCTEPHDTLCRLRTAARTLDDLYAHADAGDPDALAALTKLGPAAAFQIRLAGMMLDAARERIDAELRQVRA